MGTERLRIVTSPKALFLMLLAVSIFLVGLTYARQRYGDMRDAYPYGLYIGAQKIDAIPSPLPERSSFANITYDPYVEEAIRTGNETWVQEDDPNSEYIEKGRPDYIKWLPDNNYYHISQADLLGPTEWLWETEQLTPQTISILLGIAWVGLGIFAYWNRRYTTAKKRSVDHAVVAVFQKRQMPH